MQINFAIESENYQKEAYRRNPCHKSESSRKLGSLLD